MAFDAVITIGGQSFIDGLWRVLAPALERLTNPLPLTLPGFTNSQVRITNIVPVFPGTLPGNGLEVALTLEATAEALLQIATETGAVSISLGSQTFNIANLTGQLGLPQQTGTLTNLAFTGGTLGVGTGTGTITLPPATGALTGLTGNGTLNLPNSVAVPGIPLPAVVPIPIDLTQHLPLITRALVPIGATGPSVLTRQSLLFAAVSPQIEPIPAFPTLTINALTAQIQSAISQLVTQLGIAGSVVQPVVTAANVQALLAPVPGLIANTLADALTFLLAETGRIVFPAPGAGASCDARALPTSAAAQLVPTPNNGFELQVGISRGVGTDDIAAFPPASNNPNAALETRIFIGNRFLVSLICCLIEQLPTFGLPAAPTFGTTDINGATHLAACTFAFGTVQLGPIPLGGGISDGISICIDGPASGTKILTIVGHFSQSVRNVVPVLSAIAPTLATLTSDFTLTVSVDLDDVTSLANLRNSAVPVVATSVTPSGFLFLLIVAVLLIVLAVPIIVALAVGWFAFPVVAPLIIFLPFVAAGVVTLLVFLACGAVNFVLANAIRLLLSGAALLKSPVAIPPGILDAFGKISPASLTIDDAFAPGVMHTPTSVWGLLPRLGIPARRPPRDKDPKGKGTGQRAGPDGRSDRTRPPKPKS